MAIFDYTGRNPAGAAIQGRMEAASSAGVATELAGKGIIPLRIVPAGTIAGGGAQTELFAGIERWWNERKISLSDVIMFCRQMATLVRAGVPITRGLRGLAETMRNPEFGRILHEIADEIERGHELAGILQRHPRIFSNLFVAVVHIGETSGKLDDAFERLHGYLSLEEETRKRVKSAMRYPTMVLFAIVIAIGVINVFVIPPFSKLFASFGSDLPLPTRILMTSSRLSSEYWHVALVVCLGIGWWVRSYVRTAEGRMAWHRWQLSLPRFGGILERALLARFCRTLAVTLRAGLPVTQCLAIAARAVDNDWVAKRIGEMRADIESGESLTGAAHASRLFTPLVLQMIAVGEETGAVESTLAEVAAYYEREVDFDLKHISDLIEPVMIVVVGILVLGLALGVYLPMWELASASRG
ncbi:MAG: type II secretion system F family protein [Deltaproteobacteria bacterium]|nr:type II secretion system F family protein [Deltaproteobacteria bacterium]